MSQERVVFLEEMDEVMLIYTWGGSSGGEISIDGKFISSIYIGFDGELRRS